MGSSKVLGQRHRTTYKKPMWEMTREELVDPNVVVFDYEDLLQYAESDIADVFGPEFDVIDTYRRRVRLPAREYLLVSRVTVLDAKPRNFSVGSRMVTEYDVPINGELSEGGDVPWAVLVEAGQCDLMLISFMGVDFQCKGDRVYRLLNTTLTFFGVAKEGETLVYDIRVTGFSKHPDGTVNMFFFEYDCFCNGRLLIEMRNGCAGFFSDSELAAGKGVIISENERKARNAIVKSLSNPLMIAPAQHKRSCCEEDMLCLVNRNWAQVFGDGMRDVHYKLCSRKILMVDRLPLIDPSGGPYGLGLLVGVKNLARKHWYFPCHFVHDEVMAGSLVSDGCSQMLKTYMLWLGLHTEMPEFDFVPVPGKQNKVRCRGQISPHEGELIYIMEVKELGRDPETGDPFAVADVMIVDVNKELGQTFSLDDLHLYGKGDLSRKIVVDFKGIALQMKKAEAKKIPLTTMKTAESNQISSGKRNKQPNPEWIASNPESPNQVSWHPLLTLPGAKVPSFSPSDFPPRAICFTPFPGNPLDNNYTPGEYPLNWYNICEFMCGKVSNCLGPEFTRFDVSKTSRSPAFDLSFVTRVNSVHGLEHKNMLGVDVNPGTGSVVAEFDCPNDAWFFLGSCNDSHPPYSVIMEISLQSSGMLTSILKAPLTFKEKDILFRNLDGEGEMLVPTIDLRGKTIKNETRCTGYSMMGSMAIHRFAFVLSVDETVFYRGTASFGWFTPDVFANQAGLDNGRKTSPWWIANGVSDALVNRVAFSDDSLNRKLASSGVDDCSHAFRRSSQCKYLDYCNILPAEGLFKKGYLHGHRDVNPQDWFFSCHFWFDPVMPGSLGIESMFELMETFALTNDLPQKHGIKRPTFSHSNGKTTWKYRGQLTPKNKVMDSEVHIKDIVTNDDGGVEIVADGFLWVDGLRVYSASGLRICLVEGPESQIVQSEIAPVLSLSIPAKLDIADKSPLSGDAIRSMLLKLDQPLYLQQDPKHRELLRLCSSLTDSTCYVPPCSLSSLGHNGFMNAYGVSVPLYTGAMAKGIASADIVIAAGKRKILASFGAGGLPIQQIRVAIDKIQAALPNGPFAVNLIHSPFDNNLEKGCVDLLIEKKVRVVEASAFMTLTAQVVRYRTVGLSKSSSGEIVIENKLIAKVSRTELAEMFIRPAPSKLLNKLLASGEITSEQAKLAALVPMADDICVESDSGGHTDNRPIHVILPLIISTRNRVCKELNYSRSLRPRVGAGGGIGCPASALAAFNMGAAFIVTGTVNQLSRESGTCDYVRKVLSKASYSDVTMAAAADMFDDGVKLQVLKKGTLFASKANKLYELYRKYDSFESMPETELNQVETRIFRKPLGEVWQETVDFYVNVLRNPDKIERAKNDLKLKMSLCCKWYLGLASFWANRGIEGRELDYQIWCGPAIGAFNDFAQGTYLDAEKTGTFPSVAQINLQILQGACYLQRLNSLKNSAPVDFDFEDYRLSYKPESPL